MPNWAYSCYKVVGNKKDVKKLNSILKKLDKRKTARVKNGFGKLWLGCLITALGGDWQKIPCRGQITYFELDDDVLTIDTETAWGEAFETRKFIESCFPGMKIYYDEQEEGMGIYNTNDKEKRFFTYRYFLDSYDAVEEPYFDTIEEAAECVSGIVGHKVEPTTKAICSALNDYVEEHEGEDVFFSFHEYQVCDD